MCNQLVEDETELTPPRSSCWIFQPSLDTICQGKESLKMIRSNYWRKEMVLNLYGMNRQP